MKKQILIFWHMIKNPLFKRVQTHPIFSLFIISVITCVIMLLFFTKLLNFKGDDAILSVILGSMALILPISISVIQGQFSRKPIITLITDTDDKQVRISCRIEHRGICRTDPHNAFLFIDEGVPGKPKDKFYFNFLTDRKILGEKKCFISAICMNTGKNNIKYSGCNLANHTFERNFIYVDRLKCLSPESMLKDQIAPGETHNEDVVIQIPDPGTYRAFVVLVEDHEYKKEDYRTCACAMSIFRIKGEKKQT